MFSNSDRRLITNFFDRTLNARVKAMLLQRWFIIALALAIAHQVLQKILQVSIPFVDSYLDPLLFLPILLHLILLERRYVFGKGSDYTFSWPQIIMVSVLISVVCEVLFPRWSPSFTADYKDTVCYFIGGIVFGIFFNSHPYER